MIVPFAAGGPTDVIARVVAQKLTESLGQQFYVENLPGAGGNTGTARPPRRRPTATRCWSSAPASWSTRASTPRVPYDPVKDFAPLTLVAESPNVLFVHPSVPAKSVKELIALVKANPGKYSYAQPSTGSTPHLSGELFKLTVRARPGDGAVHQRRACRHLDHCGAHADRLHRAAAGDHQHPGGQAARPRGAEREARGGAARRADVRRKPACATRRPTR